MSVWYDVKNDQLAIFNSHINELAFYVGSGISVIYTAYLSENNTDPSLVYIGKFD